MASELAPAPLGHDLEAPGKHSFKQSPTDERAFMKVQIPGKKFPHTAGHTKYKFGCT